MISLHRDLTKYDLHVIYQKYNFTVIRIVVSPNRGTQGIEEIRQTWRYQIAPTKPHMRMREAEVPRDRMTETRY